MQCVFGKFERREGEGGGIITKKMLTNLKLYDNVSKLFHFTDFILIHKGWGRASLHEM